MQLLPNSMFDDGTAQCKTFILASQTETYVVEWSYIETLPKAVQNAILSLIEAGHHHLPVSKLDIQYVGRLWTDHILEIQWD